MCYSVVVVSVEEWFTTSMINWYVMIVAMRIIMRGFSTVPVHVSTVLVEMFWIYSKSPIPWPPMIVVEVWREFIIITHVNRCHMISRESTIMYIVGSRMIEIRESYLLMLLVITTISTAEIYVRRVYKITS